MPSNNSTKLLLYRDFSAAQPFFFLHKHAPSTLRASHYDRAESNAAMRRDVWCGCVCLFACVRFWHDVRASEFAVRCRRERLFGAAQTESFGFSAPTKPFVMSSNHLAIILNDFKSCLWCCCCHHRSALSNCLPLQLSQDILPSPMAKTYNQNFHESGCMCSQLIDRLCFA